MKKVMTVAAMLLVSLSVSLLVSCPSPTNKVEARMYRYDANEDKVDVEVNVQKSFKVAIELKNDVFNPANAKENTDISGWFVLSGMGGEATEPAFTATVSKLELINSPRETTDKKYDKLIADLSISTRIASDKGTISLSIPKTGLLRNAYTKSNKGIEGVGSISINSKFNQKVSVYVTPMSIAVKPGEATTSVTVKLTNATFKALNSLNLDELRKSIKVANSEVEKYYNIEINATNGVKDAVIISLTKKEETDTPKIAKTSVFVVISKTAIEKNTGIEEPTADLSCTFSFECNDNGKPTPGPSPKPEPKPEPTPVIKEENKAYLTLYKKNNYGEFKEEDKTGTIIAKVGEPIYCEMAVFLDKNSNYFNEDEIRYELISKEIVKEWFKLENVSLSSFQAECLDFNTSVKDPYGFYRTNKLRFAFSFVPVQSTENGKLTMKLPVLIELKPFRVRPTGYKIHEGVTEAIQLTNSIKIVVVNKELKSQDIVATENIYTTNEIPINYGPITLGDRREVELHMVKSYDAATGEIEYDENASLPVLKKGVYNDVFFAIDLRKGMRFNTKYLAPTKRGDFTNFISGISRDDFEYSAYLMGPRGWYYDTLHSIVVVCLHIMPKESAKDKSLVSPTIVLQPRNSYDCKPMIFDMSGKVVKYNIEIKDKLNMVVEEGNNAGMYFTINRIATRHYSESHKPWTIKLINMHLKDPNVDLSKYITLKGFAIGRDNPWADHFIKIFKEDNMGFRYVYDSLKNEISLYKKYPSPGLPCVSFYNDINFTDGFTLTIDPSILEIENGATLVKDSDILYYCGMHTRWSV